MSKHWRKDLYGNLNPEYDPKIGFLETIMTKFSIGINEISRNVIICELINELKNKSYNYSFLMHQVFTSTTKMIAIDLYKLFEGKNEKDKTDTKSFSVHKYEYWLSSTDFEFRSDCIRIFENYKAKIESDEITEFIVNNNKYRNNFLAHWDLTKPMQYQYDLALTKKIVKLTSEMISSTTKIYDQERPIIIHKVEQESKKLLEKLISN